MKNARALWPWVAIISVITISSCGKEEAADCSNEFMTEFQKLEQGVRGATTQAGAAIVSKQVDQFEQKWSGEECMGTRERSPSKEKLSGKNEAIRLRGILNKARGLMGSTTGPQGQASPNPTSSASPTPTSSSSPSVPVWTPTPTPTTTPAPTPTVPAWTPTPSPTVTATPTPSPTERTIEIFSTSDSCTGTPTGLTVLRAGIDSLSQCTAQLGSNASRWAWSIRLDGQCQNIPDTTALLACAAIDAPIAPDTSFVYFYETSDSCGGAVLTSKTIQHSQALASQCVFSSSLLSKPVWSVKLNGVCTNISDTDIISACYGLDVPKTYDPTKMEIMTFGGSGCSGTVAATGFLVPDLDLMNQCQGLTRVSKASSTAASVRVNGVCSSTGGGDFVSSCLQIAPASTQGLSTVLFYPDSDSCQGFVNYGGYLSFGSSRTRDCLAFKRNPNSPSGDRIWSIRIDGACKNISDSDFKTVCNSI